MLPRLTGRPSPSDARTYATRAPVSPGRTEAATSGADSAPIDTGLFKSHWVTDPRARTWNDDNSHPSNNFPQRHESSFSSEHGSE